MMIRRVPSTRALIALLLLMVLIVGVGNLWNSFNLNSQVKQTQREQQDQQAQQQKIQKEAGMIVEGKICRSLVPLEGLSSLRPPAGDPATNPSRAFEQQLVVKLAPLAQLGDDIGCPAHPLY